ncbi:MAG TPA: glycoside hydrolase family 2 TIM barrel-domain containing protein [Candidatus Limnocylindrales bacterium]|nr:glycoside hydrolase family 2 TIM barrel-domain containing protein [Candidatus Limnocylindrales bacterium]
MTNRPRLFAFQIWVLTLSCPVWAGTQNIPLPEHPRPDFERAQWMNLNGLWEFQFDGENRGLDQKWFNNTEKFPEKIMVPFPWGSESSGVEDKATIAWYERTVQVPESWQGQRVFVVIGACDWETQGWLDGVSIGSHQGGYIPFEFELTPHLKPGKEQKLVLRVDDSPRAFKLEGKQGYGNARGIWQTVYLEARPQIFIQSVHFIPDIDQGKVTAKVSLSNPSSQNTPLKLQFKTGEVPDAVQSIPANATETQFDLTIPRAHLWSLEDPFLYEVDVSLQAGNREDRVASYFGMRKVSVRDVPGLGYPYIALNNKPIYLQLTLDQSYHPKGFYTFPSDAFMRDEILRSRRLGLNANRLHVKVDVPRKLYWADRLGLLLMADVPNSWGQPDVDMRREIEQTLRGMIRRDFNHPAIFAWVPFNETWGLFSGKNKERKYLPDTQDWVGSIYRLGKQLDPSRLVEDNSACNYDHVETDINSWHAYLPGYAWREHLDQVSQDCTTGSKWNFIGDRAEQHQPLLNSECGNVWGYEGSTGDCDWSWDYHIMMNEFRRHPKICGWLYTEHHDVINEWNGYYRFDRSEKFTGLEELVSGMSLRDLHAPFYISTGSELCRDVKPAEEVSVPLWASFVTDRAPGAHLRLRAMLTGWDTLGRWHWFSQTSQDVPFEPWLSRELEPLKIAMPAQPVLAVLTLALEDEAGAVLHRNFTTFLASNGPGERDEVVDMEGARARLIRFSPASFKSAQWSLKQWNVMEGLKVNGAGSGYFEYHVPWPSGLETGQIASASLVFEASAKQLFGKDLEGAKRQEGDFMLGKGTHDPSLNPNSYPMTDTVKFPSAVRVRFGDESAGEFELPDDPADHRGILSWHAQKKDRKLREAGSYGYLITTTIPSTALQSAAQAKEFVIRLEVDSAFPGGLAVYGERFGRYPVDPTLIFTLK